MRKTHYKNWSMARQLKNEEQETQTLEYGEKHSKTCKMTNARCRTWSVVRKLKIMKIEKHTH